MMKAMKSPIPEILNNSLVAAITVPQRAQCIQDRDNNVGFNLDLEGGVEMVATLMPKVMTPFDTWSPNYKLIV